MKTAMIICAGFGTRMREYTKNTPKPMLPVCGKPILEYTVRHLEMLGIKDLIINLHYLPDSIKSYFEDGKKFGVKITYSYEEKPLGTAGAVKKVENLLKEKKEFLLLYGDVFCDEDYNGLFEFHGSKTGAVGTIILHRKKKSNSVVEIDADNRVTRFIERPETEVRDKKQEWVNSGLYCFSSNVLGLIPPNTYCDFPGDIFPQLVRTGVLFGYPLKGYRCCIDTPESYMLLQETIGKGGV